MIGRLLMTLAAVAGLGAPVSASASSEARTTICHRTTSQAIRSTNLFPGQVITVSAASIAQHVQEHGDVVVGSDARRELSNSRSCAVDGDGAVFDGSGKMVQPAGGGGGTAPISGPQ